MAIMTVISTLTDQGVEVMGPDILIYHYPSANIVSGSLLTVESNHFCVLKSRGAILNVYETGQYPITTGDKPIVGSFVQGFFGGQSPWQYEALYINRAKLVVTRSFNSKDAHHRRRWCDEFERGMRVNRCTSECGEVNEILEHRRHGPSPERRQRRHHLGGIEPARGVERASDQIHHSFQFIAAVEVARRHAKEVKQSPVTKYECTRVKGLPPEFVKVNGHRVRELDPAEARSKLI